MIISEKQILSHCCLQCLTAEESNHGGAVQVHPKDRGGPLFSANIPAALEVNAEMEVTFLSGSLRQLLVKHDVKRYFSCVITFIKIKCDISQRAVSSGLPVWRFLITTLHVWFKMFISVVTSS